MKGAIVSLLLGLAAALWEISVRPFLPLATSFHPLIPMVILLLITTRRSRALIAAGVGGGLLDVYSFTISDLAILRLLAMILLLDLMIHHWLTHRSIYAALVLVILGRTFERLTAGAVASILNSSSPRWLELFQPGVFLWDVLAVGIGFLCLALWTRRFLSAAMSAEANERSWYGR